MSFRHEWTDDDKMHIADLLVRGLSASEIAAEFNVTRNAIIGIVHRSKGLRAIGFDRAPGGGHLPPLNNSRAGRGAGPAKIFGMAAYGKRPSDFKINVPKERTFILPQVGHALKAGNVKVVPTFRVITNTDRLIADHIAKHGVRRFEGRDTADYQANVIWLRERGYQMVCASGLYRIINSRGRKVISTKRWREAVKFIDGLRKQEGLPTILPERVA